jgi:hypothetical protein
MFYLSVDLYPIVHRRSQDHILNRVRNLCIIILEGSESLAPSYECCEHDHHAVSRGVFLSFSKARFVFDELSGWYRYTSIFCDHPKEEKKSSSSHKNGNSDSYILITPIPRLSYQTQTINVLKTFMGRRNSTLVDDEFGKIVKLQASQETSEHAISLRR